MPPINRIPFHDTLPDCFFSIAANNDNPAVISALFRMEATRNEIIIYTDGQMLRLVGIFPENSTEAYFGFWETTNDQPLNERAFALLEADAQQRGRTVIVGPMNFNTFHRYRLRLNGPPSWGQFDREPVNPAYYPGVLKQLNFRIRSRFESRLLRNETVSDAYRVKKHFLDELATIPFEIIPFNSNTWAKYEDELYVLIHEVFSANPAYKPISKEQFQLLYNRRFAGQLCPHSSVLFRDNTSRKLVAMSFCQPNYQSLSLPLGDVPNFVRDFPRLGKKVLLVKTVGVHPAFRRQGLMSFLGAYGMLGFQDRYDEVIFCLMRSDNFSLRFTTGFSYETAHYALFEKPVVVPS